MAMFGPQFVSFFGGKARPPLPHQQKPYKRAKAELGGGHRKHHIHHFCAKCWT
jgi:hypothetical protein